MEIIQEAFFYDQKLTFDQRKMTYLIIQNMLL